MIARPDAHTLLARFYAELDAEIARLGLSCDGCGECCRFDVVDHVLYASDLEREYLLRVAGAPRADGDVDAALVERGLRCPYQRGGRCEARDGRALGCRLHFCRWTADVDEAEFCESWHGRLKALHEAAGREWRYGPLLPV